MTSDDGLGDPIELSRLGLFENFKSKYGADGKLNSGSNGEYRQLVGNYVSDGGIDDANPGYAPEIIRKVMWYTATLPLIQIQDISWHFVK